ncbi:MAG TPA: S8 family serine peptidase [Longimicrobiales bacterium]|nr:S8 family serine peptidase [Longimicrobiales bacterium]
MKPLSLFLFAALGLGACAPAATMPPPPAPVPVPVEAPDRPAEPPPAAAISVVPDRWWLLDPAQDGVYGAAVDRAYRELLADRTPARTVVVAIIDSGVDIEHEDLQGSLWRNPRETRNNRDDDGDGLVDDIAGWNYIGGPDGSHVDDDTYEITRLFAACQRLFGNMPGTSRPAEPVTQAECPAIEEGYADKVRETENMLVQIRQLHETATIIVGILQAELRTDSLTVEAVRGITPVRNDVRQARDIWLQLAEANITPKMISNELERLEKLMEFGLNPEFDPRHIVGDDYADPAERVYGNSDVVGPDASHGTGVAGIVAAGRGNDLGTDGIATNVQIMALRAVPNGDERDKDIANAIRYAVDHGAHIINMSFGKAWSPFKEVVDEAVRYAEERGVLLVHAAGNDGKDLATENNFPNRYLTGGDTARLWLEVGASDWRGAENLAAEFSNYGIGQVDIFAPGSQILSTAPGNTYEAASGTSFAAPVVSGVAALLMAYYPDLSAADVRRIILDSATPLRERMVVRPGAGELVRFGDLSVTGAIVNAYNAVLMAEQMTARRN